MATQASLDRVQELYVAYYGRPADQAGQEYWADRLEDEGESAIIDSFGNSAEYDELAEGQGNATLVNNLYVQMFGRDADPEGLTYYTGVLESGEKSLAEIAVTILNAASGVDLNDFNAKVEAAADYTETYGSAEDYDIVAAKDVVENAEGGLYTPELTPAIEDYQDAQQAVSDYLQDEVAANETVAQYLEDNDGSTVDGETLDADEPTDGQVQAALTAEISDAATVVEQAGTPGDGSDDLTLNPNASVAAAQIAAKQEDLQKAVSSAQDTVNDTKGLSAAITSLQGAESRFEAALSAEADTSDELTGEAAKFDALNSGATFSEDVTAGDSTLATIDNGGGATDFLVANSDGEVELASGLDASSYKGLDALISAAQAQYDAEQDIATQRTAFEKAAEKVVNLEDDRTDADVSENSGYTINSDNTVDIDLNSAGTGSAANAQSQLDAQDALSNFNEAVADYQELTGLQSQVGDLEDAVTEAGEAIEDQDVDLIVDGAAATDPGADDASVDDELFIFTGDDATIGTFGVDGEDQLYIGDSFSAVKLDSGDTLTSDDLGDVNTLEVFFQQSGNNTVLSFENKAFAGSAENGFDGTEITLTGVNAEDLQLENGYISIA